MKKYLLCAVFAVMIFALSGCSGKIEELSAKDVQNNTILIKTDGTIQSAVIEEFDENSYKEEELKQYIEEMLLAFNSQNGEGSVGLKDLDVQDTNAVMVLQYKDAQSYSLFNQMDLEIAAAGESGALTLPDTFITAKKGETAGAADALSDKNAKVAKIGTPLEGENPYQVMVEGKITHYAGGTPVDEHTISADASGDTVIVFK
ncbi:hypothetical protein [Anaerolentibacter hominis]|uniref:hypothetical protein n=1 Tax=Anaerolentibacter hominis TaxID=3079009 RepID=UPI0031B8AA85